MDIQYFLAKTDPETYPAEQLEREEETVWDGVKNPQALRAIRDMRTGDRVFLYHSMGQAAIVAVADIVGDGRPDPKNPKLAVADFRFRGWVTPPVTLREIKESGKFEDWALVRQSRLSTMHAPPEFVKWMRNAAARCKDITAAHCEDLIADARALRRLEIASFAIPKTGDAAGFVIVTGLFSARGQLPFII